MSAPDAFVRPTRPGVSNETRLAARLQRLSWLMDNSIRLPTGHRIGIDGIIGLIPGFGDLAGAMVSIYILFSAARLGVPKIVLTRMGMNIAVETVFGAIPLIGDVLDFAFKSNARNYQLIERYLEAPESTRTNSGVSLVAMGIAVLVCMALGIIAVIALASALWQALFS